LRLQGIPLGMLMKNKCRKLIKEAKMKVQKVGEKYRCSVCGNEVTVTKVGGGELVCCKKPMGKIQD